MKKQLIGLVIALGLGLLAACQANGIIATVTPSSHAVTVSPTCEWPCTASDKLTASAMLATIQMEQTLTAQSGISATPTPACAIWPCPSDSLTMTAVMAETFTAIPGNTPPAGMTVPPVVGDLGWGSVYGVITNAATGKPIENVQIDCHHISYTTPVEALCSGRTWTNGDGIYSFVPVFFHDTDTIILSVDAPGYKHLDFRESSFTQAALHADLGLEPENNSGESPTPTATFMLMCTAPACSADQDVLACGDPNGCPGGCGTICATFTPTP